MLVGVTCWRTHLPCLRSPPCLVSPLPYRCFSSLIKSNTWHFLISNPTHRNEDNSVLCESLHTLSPTLGLLEFISFSQPQKQYDYMVFLHDTWTSECFKFKGSGKGVDWPIPRATVWSLQGRAGLTVHAPRGLL